MSKVHRYIVTMTSESEVCLHHSYFLHVWTWKKWRVNKQFQNWCTILNADYEGEWVGIVAGQTLHVGRWILSCVLSWYWLVLCFCILIIFSWFQFSMKWNYGSGSLCILNEVCEIGLIQWFIFAGLSVYVKQWCTCFMFIELKVQCWRNPITNVWLSKVLW